jgi:hypothetical protein
MKDETIANEIREALEKFSKDLENDAITADDYRIIEVRFDKDGNIISAKEKNKLNIKDIINENY